MDSLIDYIDYDTLKRFLEPYGYEFNEYPSLKYESKYVIVQNQKNKAHQAIISLDYHRGKYRLPILQFQEQICGDRLRLSQSCLDELYKTAYKHKKTP